MADLVLQAMRIWRHNLDWMGWNTFLALVPLLLSLALVRQPRSLGIKIGLAIALVLFLPNAPYVLTDVIHLWQALERSTRPGRLFVVLLPQYVMFWLIGLAAYTLAVVNLRRWLKQQWASLKHFDPAWALHGLSGVGVYLGRFDRLNSWDIVHSPRFVVESTFARLFDLDSFLWIVSFTLMTAIGYSLISPFRSWLERPFALGQMRSTRH